MFELLSFSGAVRTAGSVLLALVILLAMITVHEFGHYLAGKIFRFKINEFAVGFGPALFKHKKKDGEFFSLRCIPLGGYCAFEGEDCEAPHPAAFNNKKPWQRIVVLFAGAFMNYLFALILLIVSFFACGQLLLYPVIEPSSEPVYNEYSMQTGDVVIACEGKDIYLTSDLMGALEGKRQGDVVTFTVSREEGGARRVLDIKVMLRADADFDGLTDTGALWASLGAERVYAEDGSFTYRVYTVSYRGFGFFETFGRACNYSVRIGGTIFKVLGQLLTGDLGLSAFGGPVSTVKLTSQVASRSLQQFLEISAFIGVNLAVFNLLPIPALDGSKIVFTAIEWVRGKPINRRVEAIIHAVGFVLLLAFAVLVDVMQLF